MSSQRRATAPTAADVIKQDKRRLAASPVAWRDLAWLRLGAVSCCPSWQWNLKIPPEHGDGLNSKKARTTKQGRPAGTEVAAGCCSFLLWGGGGGVIPGVLVALGGVGKGPGVARFWTGVTRGPEPFCCVRSELATRLADLVLRVEAGDRDAGVAKARESLDLADPGSGVVLYCSLLGVLKEDGVGEEGAWWWWPRVL